MACWALTPSGASLARRIAAGLGGVAYMPSRLALPGEKAFVRLIPTVAGEWARYEAHIFVAATGIVVRCIAPLLEHKTRDPAVVVCDQDGRFAISLLSGHLGGANSLAGDVARLIGGTSVITTATDGASIPAFDLLAVRAGCAFANIGEVKTVSAALLAGEQIFIHDPLGVLDAADVSACPLCHFVPADGIPADGVGVVVSSAPLPPVPGMLRLHPRRITVGVGCRKGTPGVHIERAVRASLDAAECSPLAVAVLASADIKADEPGLREAASALGVALCCFSAEALASVPVPHPSFAAAAALGVERVGVCEAAALLAAGPGAELIAPKHKYAGAEAAVHGEKGTITVALAYGPRLVLRRERSWSAARGTGCES